MASLYKQFKKKGYNFFVGVPCSGIKDFIKELSNDKTQLYIPATHEDSALGIAVGAYLMGYKPLVYMQHNGFSNSINGILSLLKPYDIKIDMLISIRNHQEEHKYTAQYIKKLIKTLEYDNHVYFVEEKEEI